jgi:hypothetical protein
MLRKALLLFLLLIATQIVPCQDVDRYYQDLTNLKQKFLEMNKAGLNVFGEIDGLQNFRYSVELLRDEVLDAYLEDRSSGVTYRLEDFVSEPVLSLVYEMLEFISFIGSNSECNCLGYLYKFLSEFSAKSYTIYENHTIRVGKAKIGNVWHYFVYPKEKTTMGVNVFLERNMTELSSSECTFESRFLHGEVMLFLKSVHSDWTVRKITQSEITKPLAVYEGSKCLNEFPRW